MGSLGMTPSAGLTFCCSVSSDLLVYDASVLACWVCCLAFEGVAHPGRDSSFGPHSVAGLPLLDIRVVAAMVVKWHLVQVSLLITREFKYLNQT